MKKIVPIKGKRVTQQVFNEMAWKVDLPAFLKETMSNPGTPYGITFTIVGSILEALAERAIELNDPALNILMLQLGLYEDCHIDGAKKIDELRKEIINNAD